MKSKQNNIAIKVGMNVRVYRIKKKLSQEKLSELSRLSRGAISDIERGESSPSVDTVGLIAEALDVELNKLFIFED